MHRGRFVIYGLLVVAVFAPWLAWETDRNMVRRWLYPVTGFLAAASTRCDAAAPRWLNDAARDLASQMNSPANQLVFVDAGGKQAGCVNGWIGTPLLSERVTPQTRFRLASLSKIVVFMGLVRDEAKGSAHWLDEPLAQMLALPSHLKDARVADIRVRHLLNHSAGFDRMRSEDPMVIRNKKPWCPGDASQLTQTPLQFTPGARYAYANLGYCLAVVAYERRFGRSLWDALEQDMHLSDYGIDYLMHADSLVSYNFMNQSFYGPEFVQYFDWEALRAPMGMTGHAQGLASFVADNRPLLDFSRGMHDPGITCDERKAESCQDGFLERRRLGNTLVWLQRGYLYGMSALFLMDEAGNFLVWLGAGESRPTRLAYAYVEQAFLKAVH